MVIKYDGNVGIGTTSPNDALHVNGRIQLEDATTGTGDCTASDLGKIAFNNNHFYGCTTAGVWTRLDN